MRPPPTYRRGYTPTLGWASLVLLLLLVELGQGVKVYCELLEQSTDRAEWFNCESNPIMLKPIENENETKYPDVDISDFTEDDYSKFAVVKLDHVPQRGKLRDFVGNLVCSGSSLTSITNIGFKIPNENISQSVRLENNLNLTTVEFSTALKSNGTIKFTVANNRLLSPKSIEHLKKLNYKSNDSYIQEYGECVIESGPQTSFKDLENCHYIKGNLVINEETDTTSEFPETLKDIRGCVSIKSTKLTNVDFLKTIESSNCNGTHEVTKNKNLCIFPQKYSEIIQKFKEMRNTIKIEKNDDCKGECTWNYLDRTKDEKCLIITDSVNLKETKDSDNLTYLSQVEEIRGRLVISHTSLTTIDMFPKLHTIVFTENKDSAILIAGNSKLTGFDFPLLTNITTIDKTVKVFMVQENNPDFVVDDDQFEKLNNLTGGSLSVPRMNLIVQNENNSTESRKKTVKQQEEDHNNLIIGLAVGISVGLLVLIVAIVVLVIVMKRFIKKKKAQYEAQKLKDLTKRATVGDWDSVGSTVESMMKIRDANTMDSVSEGESSKDTFSMTDSLTMMGAVSVEKAAKDYQVVSQTFLKDAQRGFNLEISRTTDQKIITIIRDHLDFKAFESPIANSPERMALFVKIFKHNITYSLSSIRPRKEVLEEVSYDTENLKLFSDPPKGNWEEVKRQMDERSEFDPRDFIQACMKSSNVFVSGRVMIAALDYCLKNAAFSGEMEHRYIQIDGPINIVGDTHGSLIDLQAILSLDPDNVYKEKNIHPMLHYKYLFTGDYLDRGTFDQVSFLLITVLACYMKERFFMLRGNHEWIESNDFSERLPFLYEPETANLIIAKIRELMDKLPLVAVVQNKLFAVHGGIGPCIAGIAKKEKMEILDIIDKCPSSMPVNESIKIKMNETKAELGPLRKAATRDEAKIKEVKAKVQEMKQYLEIGETLLWSDPAPISYEISKRGAGCVFNEGDVEEFLTKFNYDIIVRGHETYGFSAMFCNRLFTVFASFDFHQAKSGVPFYFSREDFKKSLYSIPLTESIGVLRLNKDGTLHAMLLRHAYIEDSERQRCPGKAKRPPKYNPSEEEKNQRLNALDARRQEQLNAIIKAEEVDTDSEAGKKKTKKKKVPKKQAKSKNKKSGGADAKKSSKEQPASTVGQNSKAGGTSSSAAQPSSLQPTSQAPSNVAESKPIDAKKKPSPAEVPPAKDKPAAPPKEAQKTAK